MHDPETPPKEEEGETSVFSRQRREGETFDLGNRG